MTPDASYWTSVLPSELLLGFGLGLAIVPCISTATQNADPKDVGRDLGHDQHLPADRGFHRHRPVEHHRGGGHATYSPSHHVQSRSEVAQATVHGYAVASGWAAGILVLAAVLGGILINVHPGGRSSSCGHAEVVVEGPCRPSTEGFPDWLSLATGAPAGPPA